MALPPVCPVIHQTVPEIILGVTLLLGVIVSYFFQWYNIISQKSAAGLSFVMLFVGISSSWTTVLNALLLEFNRFICCAFTSSVSCIQNLMGFIQVSLVFLSFFPIYILYLYYSPLRVEYPRRHTVAVIMFVVMVLFCVAMGFASALLLHLYGPASMVTRGFAYGLGVLNMVATIAQWMPQIVQTLITKEVGSLSLILLAIQGPGNALNALFLGFSEKETVTSYLPFALSSAQQCFLLVVCVVLRIRARIKRRQYAELPEKV